LTTVVDAGASELWKSENVISDETWLTTGFEQVFPLRKREAKAAARLAMKLDKYPFAGYAAWELHSDWSVRAGLPSRRDLEKSVRALRSLMKTASRPEMPQALRASVSLRTYWEQRALFVQTMADGVFELRRNLNSKENQDMLERLAALTRDFLSSWRDAQRAARQMWKTTRDPKRHGQNEEILAEDRRRLAELRTWLRAAKKDPALCLARTPVCGTWQCVFTVLNFEPAVQRISVEQQQPDGSWREIRGRHAIEFRAEAAKPKAKITQPFSAALDNLDGALRIVCKGVGRVRILDARCTNGVETRCAREKNFLIGERAPTSGFPDVYGVTGIKMLKLL